MSTFMGGSHSTYMYMGPSYDEEQGALGQHPNQQSYEGLYDSYVPALVTGDLLSGLPRNGMLAAAHLTPTPDAFYPQQPQFHYGLDFNGNLCCWQVPPAAIPPCCHAQPSTLLAPANPISNNSPPAQPIFGYGPIIGGAGVPPTVFELHHPLPSRESSVQSSTFTNNIWSPVELQPSPSLSFTESNGDSTTCSPIEPDEDMAYWSGPQYFAYPRFDQAESDVWDSQPHQYAGPMMAAPQQYGALQPFPWSLPQASASAPASTSTSLPSDQFLVTAPVETQHTTPHDPTPVTAPPTLSVSNTTSFDSRPAPRPASRARAAPATFKVKKNIINPKSKIPEAWELEVVALKENHTYEQIKRIIAAKYGVHKAISTIRGVKRNVVLPPHLRPRKAEWGPEHLHALRTGFPKYATYTPTGTIKSVAWLKLCKYIEQTTGFPFGPTATHRIYNERVHPEDPERFPFVGVVGKGKGRGVGRAVGEDLSLDEDDHKGMTRRHHGGRKALRRVGWMYGDDQQEDQEEEDDEDDEEQDGEEDL